MRVLRAKSSCKDRHSYKTRDALRSAALFCAVLPEALASAWSRLIFSRPVSPLRAAKRKAANFCLRNRRFRSAAYPTDGHRPPLQFLRHLPRVLAQQLRRAFHVFFLAHSGARILKHAVKQRAHFRVVSRAAD